MIDYDNGVRLPEGVVPALVSETDWERAQEIVLSRRLHRREVERPEEVQLRGGIIRCGKCGRAMNLAKRGNGNRYYICSKGSMEAGACPKPSPSIKTTYIEEPVWTLVRAVLLNPAKIWDRFESREQQDRDAAVLAELRARLASVEQRRRKLLHNLELLDDEVVEEMQPRLAALAQERDEARSSVALLERRVAVRERERITSLLN